MIIGESLGQQLPATREVNADLYVTERSHLYVHYSGAKNKLLKKAFVREEVITPLISAFVEHCYVQHSAREW